MKLKPAQLAACFIFGVASACFCIPAAWAQSPYNANMPPAAQPNPPVTYSRNPLVRLPVELDEKARTAISELKLFVRVPGGEWTPVLAGPASQTYFDFKAEKDGEYAFLFVTVDRNGRSFPSQLERRAPHQVIVIDTVPPQLAVQPLPVANRDIFLKVQMRDENPDWTTVKLEYLEGSSWKPLTAASAESPGVFRLPNATVLESKVRASAADKAGNVTQREIDLGDPTQPLRMVSQPYMNTPPRSNGASLPVTPVSKEPEFKLPDVVTQKEPPSIVETIPAQNTVKKSTSPTSLPALDTPGLLNQEPITLVGGTNSNKAPLPDKIDPFLPAEINPYAPGKEGPKPLDRVPETKYPNLTPDRTNMGGMTTHPVLNTTRFILNYVVETTPFSGPTRVEFWATKDRGASWQRVNDESGGVSPAKLVLPIEGLYGICIRPQGNGQPPLASEKPQCWVEIDLTRPTVQVLSTSLGMGTEAGTMTINWTAQDKNLIFDSVNLYYANRADGPWLPIAAGVKNNGSYRWTVPQGIGPEVYIRVEVADRGGNIGRGETREPVVLPQPKVRVIGIEAARDK